MKKWFNSLWKFLVKEKINITIIPSPEGKIKNLKIRRIMPILLVLLIIGSIGSFAYLYKHYESNYKQALSSLAYLKGVKVENERLKQEIFILSEDTREIQEQLASLIEKKDDIDKLINKNKNNEEEAKNKKEDESDDKNKLKLRTVLSYNQSLVKQGLPMGGGDFSLYYHESTSELLKKMHENISVINNELPDQAEEYNELEDSIKEYNAIQAATPSLWPVADKGKGRISSEFGWRISPITGKQQYHEGMDIAVWYNTAVLATASGTITKTGWASGYGWLVEIKHGYGYVTRYGHLNKIKVRVGQKVKKGQFIALSGNSGKSTGPHLHYEVRVNNIPKNPRKYIGR